MRNPLIKAALITLLFTTFYASDGISGPAQDYSRLLEFMRLEDKEQPLYAFNDFEEGFDEEIHRANLQYFNDHPELIRKIRDDLDMGELSWSLTDSEQRLLFVPETRQEYARLFETYCKHVIDYILHQTNLSNPFYSVETLCRERPDIPNGEGVSVFLVHNLVKESVSTYRFYNERGKKVLVELKGRVFLGEIGSYTTNIHLRDDGSFELLRDEYTIWQNSATDPYTALLTPAEETLHIALRGHTEKAIRQELGGSPVRDSEDLESAAEEWVAVEEAIAGGLVHALLPPFLERYTNSVPDRLTEEDLKLRGEFHKYRYLRHAVALVKRMGYEKALEVYVRDPREFRRILIQ